MKTGIPYYRVSTDRQGQSGLGLDAQHKAVHDYARANGYELLHEFTEVESGKKSQRPILLQALNACTTHHATLLIAKLDRLGRNVAFISQLMESEVDFIALDIPMANTLSNKLIVHIMAAFAEYERDVISRRTKDALQAAKRRGVKLGQYAAILSQKNKAASISFAIRMKPIIEAILLEGSFSIRDLTSILNERGVSTFTGQGQWHVNTVHRLLKQVQQLNSKS